MLVALLLSLGVNVGVLATLGVQRLQEEPRVEVAEPPRPPRPDQLRHVGRRLELEGERLERFVALHQEFLRASRAERERLGGLRREVRGRLAGPDPDMEQIEPLLEEMAASYVELERTLAAHVLRAREMLDGEAERRYLRFLTRMGPSDLPGPHRRPGRGAGGRGAEPGPSQHLGQPRQQPPDP